MYVRMITSIEITLWLQMFCGRMNTIHMWMYDMRELWLVLFMRILYLGDKPITGTLQDPDESYRPNYKGGSEFPK